RGEPGAEISADAARPENRDPHRAMLACRFDSNDRKAQTTQTAHTDRMITTPQPGLKPGPTSDSRWDAVVARDARADGAFVYAVSSTGVYCKPSCASRRPRRDRVVFFESPGDAARAGYRACRRCRPDDAAISDPWIEKVRRACVYLANVDGHLSL